MQANYDRESHIPQGHWDGGCGEIRNDRMDEKTPAGRVATTTVMYERSTSTRTHLTTTLRESNTYQQLGKLQKQMERTQFSTLV